MRSGKDIFSENGSFIVLLMAMPSRSVAIMTRRVGDTTDCQAEARKG